ncbi:vitamin K epoxide reductase complex subunit 1 [Neodiprion lecontei]|uniref:vitamin-K-epoxide reductase (warfarin-sensitive) n=1 Tax=Neodiprion lecontei TaxID=441921 RepID=A0A6J0BEI0_NEOLC|nr:vitamin K epoxide reductase complex subunit 1 [Neodiprion lecontei]XP_046422325.1 vitamin K epoxide reductase complex subunit 1 [Neodiprion fabricii]
MYFAHSGGGGLYSVSIVGARAVCVRNSNMLFNSVSKINAGIVSSCIVGFALSYYAYIVETSKEHDSSYEAMCDISEHISCTKAFMSEYGKGFGIIPENSPFYFPNSIYGLVFFVNFALLSVSNTLAATTMLLILGVLANMGSVYLAVILYKLQDICVVCISTYLVNAANLTLAVRKFNLLSEGSPKKRKAN